MKLVSAKNVKIKNTKGRLKPRHQFQNSQISADHTGMSISNVSICYIYYNVFTISQMDHKYFLKDNQ